MFQVCLISFEFEKHRNCHSAVLSYYHMNIIPQQLHTGLSCFVSPVFDKWVTASSGFGMWKFMCDLKTQSSLIQWKCKYTNPDILHSGLDSFHPSKNSQSLPAPSMDNGVREVKRATQSPKDQAWSVCPSTSVSLLTTLQGIFAQRLSSLHIKISLRKPHAPSS